MWFPVSFAKFLRALFLTEHIRWLLLKVAGQKACSFIKKRLQHRCFPVKLARLTFILENICERLLPKISTLQKKLFLDFCHRIMTFIIATITLLTSFFWTNWFLRWNIFSLKYLTREKNLESNLGSLTMLLSEYAHYAVLLHYLPSLRYSHPANTFSPGISVFSSNLYVPQ